MQNSFGSKDVIFNNCTYYLIFGIVISYFSVLNVISNLLFYFSVSLYASTYLWLPAGTRGSSHCDTRKNISILLFIYMENTLFRIILLGHSQYGGRFNVWFLCLLCLRERKAGQEEEGSRGTGKGERIYRSFNPGKVPSVFWLVSFFIL